MINLLILPSLFPTSKADIKGIFTLDYAWCVLPYCNVSVFTLEFSNQSRPPSIETWNGVKIHRHYITGNKGSNPISKALAYQRWFKIGASIIAKEFSGIDLIHVHGSPLYGNMARRVFLSKKIPYLITEHTGPFTKISGNLLNRLFAQKAWKNASKLLTVSQDLAQQILNSGMKPPPLEVSFNPVDTRTFAFAKKNSPSAPHTFTFAGRLEAYKGGLKTVKAFEKSGLKGAGWQLNIIGDGPERQVIEEFIANHKLEDRVKMLGSMTKKEMAEIYNRSDVFVFPSEHETFGLVIAEAMSCGLPAIVGNETAPKEIIAPGTGITVSPFSIDEISKAMIDMSKSFHEYDPQQISEHIESKFGFDAFGKKLYSTYKEILF